MKIPYEVYVLIPLAIICIGLIGIIFYEQRKRKTY